MKIPITAAEHVALMKKTSHTQRVCTGFGPNGVVTLDTNDPNNAWALPELLAIREAATAADKAIVRRAVFDAVAGCITELYFRNSGRTKQDRDADANEITTYVIDALNAAHEKIAERKEKEA